MRRLAVAILFAASFCCLGTQAESAELYVGTASTDITPALPVAVAGQFNLRIARAAETPLTANIAVLESREGNRSLDAAVMVSCDLIGIPEDVLGIIRQKVGAQAKDLPVEKIFINATHTHTGPVINREAFRYKIPVEGVTQVDDCINALTDRIAEAVVKAWKNRAPGSVSWGLSYAVVGHNRRSVYADGSGAMYGPTDKPEFRNFESGEDHDVNTLFFWNKTGKLVGLVVNIACPSQEVESRSAINADFWHPVRRELKKRYGDDVCVLGWPSACGDQSPHMRYRAAADERMLAFRKLDRMDEIARRLAVAVDEAYEAVKNDRRADVVFAHRTETLKLPLRPVTETEYAEAKADVERLAAAVKKNPQSSDVLHTEMTWKGDTVRRYELLKKDPKATRDIEIHVVRIGDVAVCTNPFELFLDYGLRMKTRSPALQTFLIQLTGPGTYLPTEKAVKGGGYSAVIHSSPIGPVGGQILVDRTVQLMEALWPKKK